MTPFTFSVTQQVPMERVTNCIVGALEGGYSPWLHSFIYNRDDTSNAAMAAAREANEVWYSHDEFWTMGGSATAAYDTPDDDEGDGTGRLPINLEALQRGLTLMQTGSASHFADLIAENDDAITHDVFMQYVILGEIVYG